MTTPAPFPYRLTPMSNVAGITYQDGATYITELEAIKAWLNGSLIKDVNDVFADVAAQYQSGIGNAEQTVTDAKAGWDARYDAFIANFTNEVRLLNESAVAGMVPAGAVHTALITLIDAEIAAATTANHAYTDAAVTTARTALETADTANAATAATNLATLNTQLRADLETKSAVDLIRGIYPPGPIDIVTIGDSYFSGYQPAPTPWIAPIPQVLTDQLNARGLNQYRLHNYANNAGGYDTTIGGGDTYFDTQVSAAIADTAITNCRYIIVGGGRNDAQSGKDVYMKAKAIYGRLKTKWPKAELVVFPMWSNEPFGPNQRRTFTSIFRAAKDVGAVYDVNSLWTNSITQASEWIDTVPHPKADLVEKFAYALNTLIQGGTLQPQTVDLSVHSSSGTTAGVATINGWTVTLSFQQYVGANFDGSYVLATVQYPALRPYGYNQYMLGYSGNGNNTTLYTVASESGNIMVTFGSGTAGLSGLTGSYPLGM